MAAAAAAATTYLFWIWVELIFRINMLPYFLHIGPISHYAMLHGITNIEQTTILFGQTAQKQVVLEATSHHSCMLRSANTISQKRILNLTILFIQQINKEIWLCHTSWQNWFWALDHQQNLLSKYLNPFLFLFQSLNIYISYKKVEVIFYSKKLFKNIYKIF